MEIQLYTAPVCCCCFVVFCCFLFFVWYVAPYIPGLQTPGWVSVPPLIILSSPWLPHSWRMASHKGPCQGPTVRWGSQLSRTLKGIKVWARALSGFSGHGAYSLLSIPLPFPPAILSSSLTSKYHSSLHPPSFLPPCIHPPSTSPTSYSLALYPALLTDPPGLHYS